MTQEDRTQGVIGAIGAITVVVVVGFALFMQQGVRKVRLDAARSRDSSALKQITLAVYNYSDTFDGVPPSAITDKNGKPLLSWRVMILPQLEMEVFKQFHLDEPWDSPHNITLLDKMPSIYKSYSAKYEDPPNVTHFRVFSGKGTPFTERARLGGSDFKRGPANTILIVEVNEPVPWTKPDELEYAPDKPLPKLGVNRKEVLIVTCDYQIRRFAEPLDEAAIRKMIRLGDE